MLDGHQWNSLQECDLSIYLTTIAFLVSSLLYVSMNRSHTVEVATFPACLVWTTQDVVLGWDLGPQRSQLFSLRADFREANYLADSRHGSKCEGQATNVRRSLQESRESWQISSFLLGNLVLRQHRLWWCEVACCLYCILESSASFLGIG